MELIAKELQKTYGKRPVVRGIGLHVRAGEIVGLLGPNGAGKTTTFYCLVGFVQPDSGSVTLDGQEVVGLPMYKRARLGLGYLAQEPTVFKGLTVEENLRAVLERAVSDKVEQARQVKELLEEFGLWKLKDQKSFTLSGGEKRRLEVARAMIHRPKILLLDEPFVGIDPITVSDLKAMIFKLREQGLGIIITDHNVRETLPIIDRAYLIYDGKILMQGTSDELLRNEDARKHYLGHDFEL
jgi:lipopolysaccharide export system ATP-binding protein